MKLPNKIDHNNPLPFNKIDWNTFLPQLETLQKKSLNNLLELIKKPTTFENTIVGLNQLTTDFDNLSSIFFSLTSVFKPKNKAKFIDDVSQKINILNIELTDKILFNKELFKKVESLYNSPSTLSSEDKKLLEITYKSFIDTGINLPPESQQRLNIIHEELGELFLKFDSNILKDSEASFIYVQDKNELSGLSLDLIEESKFLAEDLNYSGYVLPVNEVNYCEILENAHNRSLREKMYLAFRSIGAKPNHHYNNFEIVKKILELRKEESKIHGFNNYIDYTLKDRMVKNISTINETFKLLEDKAKVFAKKEQNKLKKIAQKDNIVLQKWDEYYYQNILKEKELNLDFNSLREFFPLKTVWQGLQNILKEMYNISFIKAKFPVYKKDVEVYIVQDNRTKTILGTIYMDWFSHPEKQDGAWMNPIISNSQNQESIILLAFNFLKAGHNLLSINDVKTLFHEVGHGLHSLFSNQKYDELNGINVSWDFIELPSQIMENFVLEPEILPKISSHYLTKKPLDSETVKKLQDYNYFFASSGIIGNIQFAKIDLTIHELEPSSLKSFDHIEDHFHKLNLTAMPKGTSRISSFDHIFSGAYAVGYYSYLWSELLDSDCYTIFKKNGILNPLIADQFRTEILEQGNIRDEAISFKTFMKRDLMIESFLNKKGLK